VLTLRVGFEDPPDVGRATRIDFDGPVLPALVIGAPDVEVADRSPARVPPLATFWVMPLVTSARGAE
jgi:hypothetical protein